MLLESPRLHLIVQKGQNEYYSDFQTLLNLRELPVPKNDEYLEMKY